MSKIKEFYDADAEEYDEKRFRKNDWQNAVHQELLREFLTTVSSDSHILEIGCGTGRFTSTLVNHSFDTTALDISQSMLQEARLRCKDSEAGKQPTLLNGDVSSLPFDNNSFDVCVMINVASHLPDPIEAFSEISRVVRNDGRTFTNFTNLFSPYLPVGIIVNLRGQSVQEDVYSNWYSWNEINNVLTETGFKVERMRGHMIPPRGDYPIIDDLIKTADALSRDTLLRLFAGNRFYHLRVQKS